VANALPDPVPTAVKEERRRRFMALQAQISAARLKAKVGQTMTVLIDEINGRRACARSSADAPEIDGSVFVNGVHGVGPGEFLDVRITRAGAHDLWARPV
jgi:ribosomal protein S12 methylthiotransferase